MSDVMPMQDECDMSNPEEHFLWSYVGLPMGKVVGNAPLITHPDVLRGWSRRQWNFGFRHHRELQTHKLVPPVGGYHPYGPPITIATVADADKLIAEHLAAEREQFDRLRAEAMRLAPDLAAHIDSMSGQEKTSAREELKIALTEQMRQMQDMLTRIDTDEQA